MSDDEGTHGRTRAKTSGAAINRTVRASGLIWNRLLTNQDITMLHFEPLSITSDEFDTAPLAPSIAQSLSGEITTRTKVHFRSVSPVIASGVWECEPGLSRWTFTNRGEFIHVVSGRMTVTRDGEEPVVLTPGTSAVFELGWEGTWEVHETLRKAFVVFRPEGKRS